MTLRRLSPGVLIGIAVVAAVTLVGQTPQPSQPGQTLPTFRAGVQMIDVDVVVTDKRNQPVRGLTKEDFEIIEERQSQEIRTFTPIDLPFDPPKLLAARRGDPESDVVTNTMPEGRTYVLLADVAAEDLRARHVAERWLDEVVQPTDRVAVVNVRGSGNDSQGFTNSRRLILSGINHMILRTGGPANNLTTRQLDSLRAIRDIAVRLGAIPGQRKAIVWFTRNPPIMQPTALSSASDVFAIQEAWREAVQAAANNNVAVYPVDPGGLTTDMGLDVLLHNDSMREVAEATGGVAVGVNTNDFSRGFATILQDASTYYLLGYSPLHDRLDGRFYSIQVRVNRKDVTVRARRGYYALPTAATRAARRSALPPAPPGVSSNEAREALLRAVPTRGLGLDVTTASFKGTEKEAVVVIVAHVRGSVLDDKAGQQLAVSYRVLDVDGRLASSFYKVFGFTREEERNAAASGTGLRFVHHLSLKPGRYELRLVAEQLAPGGVGDPGAPLGSVITYIDASKFSDKLAMSEVMLASGRANEVPLTGGTPLPGVLPAVPTALRRFRPADGLSVYAEVYTKLKTSSGSLPAGAGGNASLNAMVATPSGDVILRGQAQRVSADPVGEMLREGFRTDFDLTAVKPGPYVLTLDAQSPVEKKKTVRRQIPFTLIPDP
jgi:Ca-activated chloride channel family protein